MSSQQASGLLAAFPMWEPPGTVCQDVGPQNLAGGVPQNILGGYDTYFGDVYIGDGDGGGSTPVRYYKIPYSSLLDIGLNPRPFSVSCWIRTLPGAAPPATDFYVFANDTPTTPFSGFACSLDSSNNVSFNTANGTLSNAAARTTPPCFDGLWHHYLFVHLPSGNAAQYLAQQINYIDGNFDTAYTACADVGPTNGNPFYFGIDDDGATGQFGGYFFDLRIYEGAKTLSDARAMYHSDTRWELYAPPRGPWMDFNKVASAAAPSMDWLYQRPEIIAHRVKTDLVPSGSQPGKGLN